MDKLLPCPFCPGMPSYGTQRNENFREKKHIIYCYICKAKTGPKSSKELAIEAWNTRSPMQGGEIDRWMDTENYLQEFGLEIGNPDYFPALDQPNAVNIKNTILNFLEFANRLKQGDTQGEK